LGNTAYELGELELDVTGAPFIPSSVLNQLRREAVEKMTEWQSRPAVTEIRDPDQAVSKCMPLPPMELVRGAAQLHLLVRTPEQLEAAIGLRPASVTLDYLDLYGLRPSIERVKEAGLNVRVASPRVLKPGEERIAEFLLRCDCPILVRSAGLLYSLRECVEHKLFGDFSLNAANAIAASHLMSLGLERLPPG